MLSDQASPMQNLFLGVRNSRRPIITRLLYCRPLLDPLAPFISLRILLLPLVRELFTHNMWRTQEQPVPWLESQVCVGALITHQILPARLLQMAINHTQYSADLIAVALKAGVDVLRMVENEPGTLAEVRAFITLFVSLCLPRSISSPYTTYLDQTSGIPSNTSARTSPATKYNSSCYLYRMSRADNR